MSTVQEDVQSLRDSFSALETRIEDLLGSVKEGGAPLEEISTAIVEFSENYASGMKLMEQLIAAMKGIKISAPAVTVDVSPTPIHNHMPAPVVQILERVQPGSYKFDVEYDRHDRIISALLTPVPSSPAARR